MGFDEYVKTETTSAGKVVVTGNIFLAGRHGSYRSRDFILRVPRRERKYLVYIFPTMLSARGGDFDEDDTVYVDLYAIDGIRRDSSNGFGGAWDHHFGSYGNVRNMAISCWVGYINNYAWFRIGIQGDDWVGASFIAMEL